MPTVKIEGGAKSALDPHRLTTIKPYIADDLTSINFAINNIVTINPELPFGIK